MLQDLYPSLGGDVCCPAMAMSGSTPFMPELVYTLQTNLKTGPYLLACPCMAFLYLYFVRQLRHRRTASHTKLQHEKASPETFQMTIPTAQKIYTSLFDLEFPFFFLKGIQLALFRTYTIPTISSLLVRTNLLSSANTTSKRYAETELLFYEWTFREWGSAQWLQAMARLRGVHTDYRKMGKIKEEDMLFTLAAMMTQPVYLIEAWEWRSLIDIELCAIGTLYRAIAEALDIDHAHFLQSPERASDLEPNGYYNGLEFFYALKQWQRAYELGAMVFTPDNKTLTKTSMDLFFCAVPTAAIKQFLTDVFAVIMDPLLRTAAGLSPPSRPAVALAVMVLQCRQFILRHLCLPRPEFLSVRRTTLVSTRDMKSSCAFTTRTEEPAVRDQDNSKAFSLSLNTCTMKESARAVSKRPSRVLATSYIAEPYFVPPSIWNRWSPGAWWYWFLGLPLPGDRETFQPKGASIPDLGPNLGKTAETQQREEEALRMAEIRGKQLRARVSGREIK